MKLKNSSVWVLWKGALAIGSGTAAAIAIMASVFNCFHPNYVDPRHWWKNTSP
jgi:putative flippase GtrA